MGLKELRKARRITQEELAKDAGVSQSYVCALENGKRANPSMPVLRRIAKRLGVSTSRIINEIDKAV